MASLVVVLAVVCACLVCSQAALINPDEVLQSKAGLGIYQDMGKCARQGTTWYVWYRNTEEGPFGPHDYCLRDTQISELADGKARFRFRYGHGHERNATFTFRSSEGQTSLNVVEIQLDGAPEAELYDVLFVDCEYCMIMRTQIGGRCMFSVTEAAFRNGVPLHCQYVYDLFYGNQPRYLVSDARCLAEDSMQG